MLNCAEQLQKQKYKTHAYKTLKTADGRLQDGVWQRAYLELLFCQLKHRHGTAMQSVFNQCVLPTMTDRCQTSPLTKAGVKKL